MDKHSTCTYVILSILVISFILFNCSFWIDQWSKSENSSQGFIDLCFKADGNNCCQSFSDRGEDTPVWFQCFKYSLYAAWIFIALIFFLPPHCIWHDEQPGKRCLTVLLILACFFTAVCIMVAVFVYGLNFKSNNSFEHHELHSSFGIAIVSMLLYGIVGIVLTVITISEIWHESLAERERNIINVQPAPSNGTFHLSTTTSFSNRLLRRVMPYEENRLDKQAQFDQPPFQTQNYVSRQKWQQMNENLKIVDLDQNSREYKYIEREFLTNNEDFEVIQIFKIQNKRLYNAHKFFGENFMDMAKQRHPRSYTKCLWHGTSDEAARNINQYGFNRSYRGKNACAYGDGVYFATEPSYSSHDTYAVPDSAGRKRVYKCSVYVGRYTRGEHAMKDPPIDRDGVRFDSTVNNPEYPTIHVIFFDNQAYMENLIIFKRNMY